MGHPETRVDSSRRRKSLSQPLAQIIENFHRIKEERFKQRLNYSCNSPYDGRQSRDRFDHDTNRVKFADDIHIIQLGDAEISPKWRFGVSNGRRVSLPSLFHPFSPTTGVTAREELSPNDNTSHNKHHTRRRHSVSHVMVEYSKHDLEELAKQHELKLEQINNEQNVKLDIKLDRSDTESDSDHPRWMNGGELHAFYHGWESGYLKPKRSDHSKRRTPMSKYDGPLSSRIRYDSF